MGTSRRDFFRILGTSGAVAIAAPGAAWGDRLRILGGGGGPEQPYAVGRVDPDFQRFVGGVRVGQTRGHGPLQVFWLHGTPGVPLLVATL